MEHALLAVHVVAAIVFVGGSAVAASLFPKYAPIADAATNAEAKRGGERNRAVAAAMHRVTGGYAAFGLVVPAAGLVLAGVQGRLGEVWITVSMVLTAVAGLMLAVLIHPRQKEALRVPAERKDLTTLSMLAGVYNLMWGVVVVLMIVRPGTEAAA